MIGCKCLSVRAVLGSMGSGQASGTNVSFAVRVTGAAANSLPVNAQRFVGTSQE